MRELEVGLVVTPIGQLPPKPQLPLVRPPAPKMLLIKWTLMINKVPEVTDPGLPVDNPVRSQTVAPTVPDPPSPDPTRQAAKKAKLSPSKSFYPPSDQNDAIGKGWSLRDMGGEGDCFYRCAGTATSKEPAKVTEEAAKIQGRFVRVKVVEHVRKHHKRFSEIFPNEDKFQEWCEETAKAGTWVEGTALQAFSEKYGLPVVIWSHKTNVWTRMVVAPRFSSGVACAAKDSVPLCLQLKDQHYQILVPPDQGKIPSNWLKETPNVVIDLRGAGRSLPSSSPSVVTRASVACPTPSVHTMASGSCVPGTVGTPSVATVRSPAPVSPLKPWGTPRQALVRLRFTRPCPSSGAGRIITKG